MAEYSQLQCYSNCWLVSSDYYVTPSQQLLALFHKTVHNTTPNQEQIELLHQSIYLKTNLLTEYNDLSVPTWKFKENTISINLALSLFVVFSIKIHRNPYHKALIIYDFFLNYASFVTFVFNQIVYYKWNVAIEI